MKKLKLLLSTALLLCLILSLSFFQLKAKERGATRHFRTTTMWHAYNCPWCFQGIGFAEAVYYDCDSSGNDCFEDAVINP